MASVALTTRGKVAAINGIDVKDITGTKKAAGFIQDYNKSKAAELFQVYGTYSSRKAAAMARCKEWAAVYGGYANRILSHNSNFFTVAFETVNPDTGVVALVIETPANRYYAEL